MKNLKEDSTSQISPSDIVKEKGPQKKKKKKKKKEKSGIIAAIEIQLMNYYQPHPKIAEERLTT
jgi:hypothetical protein